MESQKCVSIKTFYETKKFLNRFGCMHTHYTNIPQNPRSMKQIPLDFKLSKTGPDTHIKKSLKIENASVIKDCRFI